jgi:hypothetical protein
VLNVYREVDAMLRELAAALADEEPRFVPLVKGLVPGATKNPDARHLRNYHAYFFVPASTAEPEDEDDEEEEDEEEDETPKQKRSLTIEVGSGLVVARVAIYDRSLPKFEPNLRVGVLTKCRVDTALPAGAQLKVPRGRFRRIVRAVDANQGGPGKPLRTNTVVQVVGQPKMKPKLVFDVPDGLREYPLFDVTPERIVEIAASIRETWRASTTG